MFPALAPAHRLEVAVAPAGPGRLRVEAGYDDGTPADGATAVVADAAGAEVGRVTLDERGVGELPRPAGGWTVTVDDGAGHRAAASGAAVPVAAPPRRRWWLTAAGVGLVAGWVVWRRAAGR